MNAATITALAGAVISTLVALTGWLRAEAAHQRINDAQVARVEAQNKTPSA